jgi:hypothetical protein
MARDCLSVGDVGRGFHGRARHAVPFKGIRREEGEWAAGQEGRWSKSSWRRA